MKRIIILAAAASVALGAPTTASGHTLNRGSAAASIALEASDFFEWKYSYDSDLFVGFPKVHKYDCWRVSRHIVKCPGTAEISDWSDSGYGAGGDQFCTFTGRARYRSHWSIEPRVRIMNRDCG